MSLLTSDVQSYSLRFAQFRKAENSIKCFWECWNESPRAARIFLVGFTQGIMLGADNLIERELQKVPADVVQMHNRAGRMTQLAIALIHWLDGKHEPLATFMAEHPQ